MADLIIRQGAGEDAEALGILDRRCFDDPWSQESFLRELTVNNRAFYLVAEINNKIVGYAGFWLIVDEGHITNVAVDPEFRKKGIGKAIVKSLTDFGRSEGITSFTLEVRAGNIAAQNLYKSFGFLEAGVRPKYYENNGEDALIMWLREK